MTKMAMIRDDNNNTKASNVVGQSSSSLEFVSFLGKGGFGSVALSIGSCYVSVTIHASSKPQTLINLDRCCIYMEFASKGTLHSFISHFGGRPIPEVMIRRAALMILQGLEALHSHGYVHCDLKPANVLLFPSEIVGEPRDLKLADFGVSKEPSRTSLSGGTKEYMPPESLGPNRTKMIGPAVDMWSLGCVVLQMSGGHPVKVGECCYRWRLPRLVSPLANDFLRRCMALQPSRRANAADLLKHPFVCTKAKSYASVLSSSSCHKTQ
ncbi:hypothetical protein Bca101_013182 [Brassica carinata]